MAWTLVQSWTAGQNTSGGTGTSASVGSTPTIGNLMVAMATSNVNTQASVVIKDGNSNVYTLTPHSLFNGANGSVAVAYWIVSGTPSTSISVTWASSATLIDLVVAEFSGNTASLVFDVDASATSPSGTTATTPSITTTAADLVVAASHSGGTITGGGGSWTVPLAFGNADSFEYLTQTSPGSQAVSFTTSTSTQCDTIIASFKSVPFVAIDAVGTETYTGTAGTTVSYTGLTTTSATTSWGGAIVCTVDIQSSTPSGVTAFWDSTGANQSMTLIGSQKTGSFSYLLIFGLVGPTTFGNKTINVSWTGSSISSVCASSWKGVLQTGGTASFASYNTAVATSAAPSVTITSAANNMVIGLIGVSATSGTLSALSGTQIYIDSNHANNGSNYNAGAATVVVSGTISGSQNWNACGFSLVAGTGVSVPLAGVRYFDWNPPLRAKDNISMRGQMQGGLRQFYGAAGQPPFHQNDWPNPQPPKPRNPGHWEGIKQALGNFFGAAGQQPFWNRDHAGFDRLPTTKKWNQSAYPDTMQKGLPQFYGAAGQAPFAQYNWPNPPTRDPRLVRQDWSWQAFMSGVTTLFLACASSIKTQGAGAAAGKIIMASASALQGTMQASAAGVVTVTAGAASQAMFVGRAAMTGAIYVSSKSRLMATAADAAIGRVVMAAAASFRSTSASSAIGKIIMASASRSGYAARSSAIGQIIIASAAKAMAAGRAAAQVGAFLSAGAASGVRFAGRATMSGVIKMASASVAKASGAGGVTGTITMAARSAAISTSRSAMQVGAFIFAGASAGARFTGRAAMVGVIKASSASHAAMGGLNGAVGYLRLAAASRAAVGARGAMVGAIKMSSASVAAMSARSSAAGKILMASASKAMGTAQAGASGIVSLFVSGASSFRATGRAGVTTITKMASASRMAISSRSAAVTQAFVTAGSAAAARFSGRAAMTGAVKMAAASSFRTTSGSFISGLTRLATVTLSDLAIYMTLLFDSGKFSAQLLDALLDAETSADVEEWSVTLSDAPVYSATLGDAP